MSFLLRVQLPDRPGSLGSLALALGAVGADILSLDVVERGAGYAVDDLVVDVRSGSLPDTLITAAEALDGVRVDSIRPFAGMLDTHRELEAHRPGGDRPGRPAQGARRRCAPGATGRLEHGCRDRAARRVPPGRQLRCARDPGR